MCLEYYLACSTHSINFYQTHNWMISKDLKDSFQLLISHVSFPNVSLSRYASSGSNKEPEALNYSLSHRFWLPENHTWAGGALNDGVGDGWPREIWSLFIELCDPPIYLLIAQWKWLPEPGLQELDESISTSSSPFIGTMRDLCSLKEQQPLGKQVPFVVRPST